MQENAEQLLNFQHMEFRAYSVFAELAQGH